MSAVLSSTESSICSVVINRPEHRNALNAAVISGIREAIRRAGENEAVRAVTISGAGDQVFCAGVDLKEAAGSTPAFQPGDYREMLLDILRCPKPTIALARGHVLAGGLGIVLACDLALACEDVHFSTPEIHVGMFPMMVLALLSRHVGRKRATEMVLLGDRMPAGEAARIGVVNRAIARGAFESESKTYLEKLATKSTWILRQGKQAMLQLRDREIPDELGFLETALARVMESEDSREGIRAFIEKRIPVWKDR
jgi:enoyl-CoA hydratase